MEALRITICQWRHICFQKKCLEWPLWSRFPPEMNSLYLHRLRQNIRVFLCAIIIRSFSPPESEISEKPQLVCHFNYFFRWKNVVLDALDRQLSRSSCDLRRSKLKSNKYSWFCRLSKYPSKLKKHDKSLGFCSKINDIHQKMSLRGRFGPIVN